MYYYIKGEAVLRQENFAVIDNGGIGYKLFTSLKTLDSFREGDKVTLYTYLNVREDVFDLYGFSSKEEHTMFLHLISVSGVGPKAALAVLSVVTPNELALAIITKDSKTLTKASGVGAKMAQRIILELGDKLKNEEILPDGVAVEAPNESDAQSEAVSALLVLGYSLADAKNAVSKVDKTLKTEEIVRLALTKLMR